MTTRASSSRYMSKHVRSSRVNDGVRQAAGHDDLPHASQLGPESLRRRHDTAHQKHRPPGRKVPAVSPLETTSDALGVAEERVEDVTSDREIAALDGDFEITGGRKDKNKRIVMLCGLDIRWDLFQTFQTLHVQMKAMKSKDAHILTDEDRCTMCARTGYPCVVRLPVQSQNRACVGCYTAGGCDFVQIGKLRGMCHVRDAAKALEATLWPDEGQENADSQTIDEADRAKVVDLLDRIMEFEAANGIQRR